MFSGSEFNGKNKLVCGPIAVEVDRLAGYKRGRRCSGRIACDEQGKTNPAGKSRCDVPCFGSRYARQSADRVGAGISDLNGKPKRQIRQLPVNRALLAKESDCADDRADETSN